MCGWVQHAAHKLGTCSDVVLTSRICSIAGCSIDVHCCWTCGRLAAAKCLCWAGWHHSLCTLLGQARLRANGKRDVTKFDSILFEEHRMPA